MARVLKRGTTLAAGLVMKRVFNYPFDYVLYPFVMWRLGYVWGGLVMTFLSVFINLLIIATYDWSKTDWLLIESFKSFREGKSEGKWKRFVFVSKILRKGDVPAFFILCLDDPITATLYLRHGVYQYNGMSRRDWKVFVAASIVANLYWIIGLAAVIEIVRRLMF